MSKETFISLGFQEDRTSFHVLSFRNDKGEAEAQAKIKAKELNIQSYIILVFPTDPDNIKQFNFFRDKFYDWLSDEGFVKTEIDAIFEVFGSEISRLASKRK